MTSKFLDAFFKLPRAAAFVLFTAVLTVVSALAMYYPLYVSLPLMVILPIFIVAFVRGDIFEKIKLSTLIIGRLIVVLAFLTLIPGDILIFLVIWLLRINILEAVIKDLKGKNFLNALSGIALIAGTWLINIHWNGVYYVILPVALIFWVLGYTIWNWNFIYLNYGASIGLYHVPVLSAPLVFALGVLSPVHWLMMRAGSLTLAVTCQMAFKERLNKYLNKKSWVKKLSVVERNSTQAALTISVLVLCLLSFLGR